MIPGKKLEENRRLCIATNCASETPLNRLFCRYHWGMLPYDVQEALIDAYGDDDPKTFNHETFNELSRKARRFIEREESKEARCLGK